MELHPILENDAIPNPDLWFVVSAFGDCPSMRVGHTCVFVRRNEKHNGKVYVIGGASPSGPFDETYVLDLQSLSWDIVESPGLRPRYEHAAFVPSSQPMKIYVFGGADQSGNMNDVQVLDTTTNTWKTLEVTGTPPSPRTHHTSVVVGDRLIVYSGGHCGAEPVGDRKVHSFDAATSSWKVIPTKGDSPKPRHGHAMVSVGSRVYLHGGMAGSTFFDDFHVLDLEKGSWSNVRRKGVYPSPRAAHSMVSSSSNIYTFGGMNQDGALDDMYQFSTETNTWSKVELQGPPPACRLDFAVCTIEVQRSACSDRNEQSADLLVAGVQAREVLERELTKPGSASSHGSQCGSESSYGAFVTHDQLLPDAINSNEFSQEIDGASADPSSKADATATSDQNIESYKMFLIHGGMDTEGQIFDDTLVYLLP